MLYFSHIVMLTLIISLIVIFSFTKFNVFIHSTNNKEAEELKVLMKNFKACLVAEFENKTAKYVYVVISNNY